MIYDFHGPIPDVVHSLHPQHLILGLELFYDAFTGRHLLNQLKKHCRGLLVQIGKISVQCAGGQQLRVQRLTVLPEIPQMPLTPNANGAMILRLIFPGEIVVVANQFILQSGSFICNVLFHNVILQIRLISAIQSFWMITKAEGRQLPYKVPSLVVGFFICKYLLKNQNKKHIRTLCL